MAVANRILTWVGRCPGRCPVPPPLRADHTRLHSVPSRIMLQSDLSRPDWGRSLVNPRQVRPLGASKKVVASRRRPFLPVIIFLTLLIQADRTPLPRNLLPGSKNILPLSNAPFVPNALPGPITCDRTFVLTPMSDRSYAPSVAKHLPDSTIGSGMRVCTLARRNLFAKVSLAREGIGVVVANLLVQMLWDDTFDPKRAESASNHCSMRKPPKELGT